MQTLLPRERARAPRGVAGALDAMRRPPAPTVAMPYVLMPDPMDHDRSRAFPRIEGLAREIHRLRRDRALQLRDTELYVQGRDEPCLAVAVYALNETSDTETFLGLACLRGGRRRSLELALYAARPNPAPRMEQH